MLCRGLCFTKKFLAERADIKEKSEIFYDKFIIVANEDENIWAGQGFLHRRSHPLLTRFLCDFPEFRMSSMREKLDRLSQSVVDSSISEIAKNNPWLAIYSAKTHLKITLIRHIPLKSLCLRKKSKKRWLSGNGLLAVCFSAIVTCVTINRFTFFLLQLCSVAKNKLFFFWKLKTRKISNEKNFFFFFLRRFFSKNFHSNCSEISGRFSFLTYSKLPFQ